jgi:hypothetical protein
MKAAEWVHVARESILALLQEENAVVWPEVEAKLADRRWKGAGVRIDPHHLTTARQQLRAEGIILEPQKGTKGGRVVGVVHLADTSGRAEAVRSAAARKRLLQARYLRWAQGENYLGPAGERAIYEVLRDLAPTIGYRLEQPKGGTANTLFGAPVPGGALDSVAHLTVFDANGAPVGQATLLIEVKNIRGWIYPGSPLLHQLLDKAARVRQAFPDYPVVPVLVCRRAPYVTFRVAKALGFYVAQTRAQFVPTLADITPTLLEELRVELGYEDMVQKGPYRLLESHFRKQRTLPGSALDIASTWASVGSSFAAEYSQLRNDRLAPGERQRIARDLEREANELLRYEPDAEEDWDAYEPDP